MNLRRKLSLLLLGSSLSITLGLGTQGLSTLAVFVSVGVLTIPSVTEASDLDKSRLYNLKALKLLKAKNHEEAIKQFQRAFYAAPSSKPLINIAMAYRQLKRDDLAIEYYRMAIEHAETNKEREDLARKVMALKGALLQKLTLLQVRTPGVEANVTVKIAGTGAKVHDCLSPCDLWMNEGDYIVVGTKTGYAYIEKPLSIQGRGVSLVALEMLQTSDRATVNITANAAGAAVIINGVRVGTTPFREALPQGKTSVRIEKRGFGPWETALDLAPGETQHVHVFLKTEGEVLRAGSSVAIRDAEARKMSDVLEGKAQETAEKEDAETGATGDEGDPKPCVGVQEKIVEVEKRIEVERIVEKKVFVGGGNTPRWLKWVFLSVGTAALGGGAGMHVVGNMKMQDANKLSPDPAATYSARFFDARDQGYLFQNQAYMLYGVGGVSLITGALLWIFEGGSTAEKKDSDDDMADLTDEDNE
jgi:PEGA domain-containing protein/tetratricopeptide repeat protein